MQKHDQRVHLLEALAGLVDCHCRIRRALPDGRRPDVLRSSLDQPLLFVGDAKETETPSRPETIFRLNEYMRWSAVHVAGGGTALFALCFGNDHDAQRWFALLTNMSCRNRIAIDAGGLELLGGDVVAWIRCHRILRH